MSSRPVRARSDLLVFVCYRREDAPGYAGRLIDALGARFRPHQLFRDIDAIPPGADFAEYLAAAVGACDILLALIGPQWLSVSDTGGRRRLDDPYDFVRLEIQAALERGIRVVPVLVQGVQMPSAEQLPDAIRSLSRRHAFPMSDEGWKLDVRRLIAALDQLELEKRASLGPGERLRISALARLPQTVRRHPILWSLLSIFLAYSCVLGAVRGPYPAASPSPPPIPSSSSG